MKLIYFFTSRRIVSAAFGWMALLLLPPSVHAEKGVTNSEILIGQTTHLTGPLAEIGQDLSTTAKAYFGYINQQGGINGRMIRLVTLDDGNNSAKTVENVRRLVENEKVFALINISGTPGNIATLPLINLEGIPSIGPLSGSKAIRKPFNRLLFHVRASYADEAEKIVSHIRQFGINNIAVVYQNSSFGQDGLGGVETILAKENLTLHNVVKIESDASDAAVVAKVLADSKPEAVVMITGGKPTVEFVKAYRKLGGGAMLFALSVMGTQEALNSLGQDGLGVVVSQVAPFPFSATNEIVASYQNIMTKMGVKTRSFTSMEAFVAARVTVEALKRTGPNLTREGFISALESTGKFYVDGFPMHFTKTDHEGSHYVELTVISRDGRFIR